MSTARAFGGLPAENRRWIFVNSVMITAFLNIVINAGLAAAGARGHHVEWWTSNPFKTNLLYNTLGTLFFLPLLTVVGVTAAVARERQAGAFGSIGAPFSGRLWRWTCASSAWVRGARFGVVTLLALAPFDVAAVLLLGRDGASAPHFVMVQVLLTVLLGAVVAPLAALAAMCDAPPAGA